MGATTEQNLFGLKRRFERARSKRRAVRAYGKELSLSSKLEEARRRREEAEAALRVKREAIRGRRAEAQQRQREEAAERREWERAERERRRAEERERRAAQKAAERAERERRRQLLQEQAHRKREAKIAEREREEILRTQKGSRRGTPVKQGGHQYWVSGREIREGHEALSNTRAKQNGQALLSAYKAGLTRLRKTGTRAAYRALLKVGDLAGLSRSRVDKDARGALAAGRPKRRGNPLQPDADHPIEVSRYYRGGGKSKRQRAIEAGQMDFWGESPHTHRNTSKQNSARGAMRNMPAVLITPEKARKLLKRNVGNRPVDNKRVEAIAKLMRAGIWKTTKAVTLTNGLLTDGQHRLLAIVRAGVPVRMKITKRTLKANPKGKRNGATLASAIGGAAAGVAGSLASMGVDYLRKHVAKKRAGSRAPNDVPKRAPANVAKLFKEFQGRALEGGIARYYVPTGSPKDGALLGELRYLKLANGRTLRFHKNAVLVGTGGRVVRKLFVGLSKPYAMPNGAEAGKAYDYGEVREVGYVTSKPHLYGTDKKFLFYHKLGEDTGVRPRLVLRNGTLALVGGQYGIKREGIYN